MILDEGIIHAEDVARIKHEASIYLADEHPTQAEKCEECAEEHSQIAEWLKELKAYREQSGDVISRQSAIFLASDLKQDLPDDERIADMVMAHNEGILEYQTQLSLLPSVTPQQRTGRWVKEGQGGRYKWMCSNCGTHHRALYDYCPSCGCKMEVEE